MENEVSAKQGGWFKHLLIQATIWIPLAILLVFAPGFTAALLSFVFMTVSLIVLFLAASPLLKESLMHDPDKPVKNGMFMEVQEGRSVCIMMGGEPRHIIRNDHRGTYITAFRSEHAECTEDGDDECAPVLFSKYVKDFDLTAPWRWYQYYIYRTTGLYAYVPFFTFPFTYDLPRYVVKEEDGRRVYKVLSAEDKNGNPTKGYRTDHLRHQLFSWRFEYHSVEIQKIPFLIRGATQTRIIPGRERDALFKTASWNVMLDNALNSVVRSVMRNEVSLDQAIGFVQMSLEEEDETERTELDLLRLSTIIKETLENYVIDTIIEIDDDGNETTKELKLRDYGIDITRVDLIDFTDELPEHDERKLQLAAAAVAREAARARMLEGMGEAEAARAILEVMKEDPENARVLIQSRAHVEGLQGSDALSALAAVFTQGKQKDVSNNK